MKHPCKAFNQQLLICVQPLGDSAAPMLNHPTKSSAHEKHLQYAKYNDRYAAPHYHSSGPNMALLPKPALFSGSSGSKDLLNSDQKKGSVSVPVLLLPKTGKKKGPKFVPKAILKKPETNRDQDLKKPETNSCSSNNSSTDSNAQICTPQPDLKTNTPPKLLQLLAKKNTKVVSPESSRQSASIEDQLSGKICAMLGIAPSC